MTAQARALRIAGRRGARRVRAFSLIELIVVTVIIALILLVGLPAFNSLSLQSQFSKTQQLVNGVSTRAHLLALHDRVFTAVRVVPADWEIDPAGTSSGPNNKSNGRQALVTYSYKASSIPEGAASDADGDGVPDPQFSERFERVRGGPSAVLSTEVWLAPAECLLQSTPDGYDGDRWLDGAIGRFRADAVDSDATEAGTRNFFDADDFLLVYSPDGGIRPTRTSRSSPSLTREPWPMKSMFVFQQPGVNWRQPVAADNIGLQRQRDTGYEVTGNGVTNVDLTKPFRRYSAAGVILYERQRLEALGVEQSGAVQIAKRREIIRQSGRTYFVSPSDGTLLGGK